MEPFHLLSVPQGCSLPMRAALLRKPYNANAFHLSPSCSQSGGYNKLTNYGISPLYPGEFALPSIPAILPLDSFNRAPHTHRSCILLFSLLRCQRCLRYPPAGSSHIHTTPLYSTIAGRLCPSYVIFSTCALSVPLLPLFPRYPYSV